MSNNERMIVNTKYLLFILNNKKEKYSFNFSFLNYPYSKIIFGSTKMYEEYYDDDYDTINIDKLLEEV